MVMDKIGLNLSVLKNLSTPNVTIGKTGKEIANELTSNANSMTNNYFGLGILVTLFFFLVWKIGQGKEFINEQYSSIRSVGISGGVCAILGFQMLNLGFFSEVYHVVIFAGITLLSWIVIYFGSRQ
jgi:hypothetical protein